MIKHNNIRTKKTAQTGFMISSFAFLLFTVAIAGCSSNKLLERDYTEILKDGPERYHQLEGLSKAKAHYIDGLTLQQKGQYANAVIDFRSALTADSAAAILFSLGESYKRLNRQELAADAYQKAISTDPEYVLPMESLAELLMLRGNMDEALKLMNTAYEIEPSFQRKYMLATIYEYTDKKKAVELYRDLIDEDNVSAYVISKLLSLYKELKMQDEFLQVLNQLYDKNNGNTTYSQDILEEYYIREEYQKGIEFLQNNEKDFTDDQLLELYVTYGDNIYRGDIDSTLNVEQLFMELIENSPLDEWRLDYLGALLAGKVGEIKKAEKFFDKVLTGVDSLPDIPLQIGLFYIDKEQKDKALSIFNEYSEKYPKDGRFPFFSGIIHTEREELDQAEKMLLKAYRIDTNNVDVITNLGLIYDKRGQNEKTQTFYEKAYNIDPDNPLLNNNYAYHLAVNGGSLDRAERMSRYALSRDPENISYLDTYGWIHYKLGNYNIALKNLEKALELGEPSAEVLEHLGDVYSAMSDTANALKYYKKSLDLNPKKQELQQKIDTIN